MIKRLFAYLLSLCILLLVGYSHLSAHTVQKGSSFFPTPSLKGIIHAYSGPDQIGAFLLKSSSTKVDKAIEKIAPTENQAEEDEVVSSKKYLDGRDLVPAVFYSFALAFLLGHLKQILLFCKQLAFFSYHRWYLLFRVFRI